MLGNWISHRKHIKLRTKQQNKRNSRIIHKDKDNPHRLLQCPFTSSISYWVSIDDAFPIGFHYIKKQIPKNSNYPLIIYSKETIPIIQKSKLHKFFIRKTQNYIKLGCRETIIRKKKKTLNSLLIFKLSSLRKMKNLHSTKVITTIRHDSVEYIHLFENGSAHKHD